MCLANFIFPLRISNVLIVIALHLFLNTSVAQQETKKDIRYYQSNLPFDMPSIELPAFPDRSVSIKDFGAIGDGLVNNSDAFARAIDSCARMGGGKVIVPSGLWLTGPIRFKSNINLYLEKGALIVFSRNHADYSIMHNPGSKSFVVTSPISGFNLDNIAITGDGIIDGSGDTWRPVKKAKTTDNQWKELLASGGVVSTDNTMFWPTKQAMEGENYLKNLNKSDKSLTEKDYEPARDFLRPYMVLFSNCNRVLFDGPTFQNSPKFVLYPNFCENVVIRNIKVLNEWWAQNGDGIDISGGKNILIYNCMVNAGDDGICMKSGKTKKYKDVSLENVIIADCVVYHAHGGFVIGSNTDGGIRNISVKNCNFVSTDVGLRFKSSRGRGGLVEHIYISDIYMKDIANQAILFDTYYESNEEGGNNVVEVNEKTPHFQNFVLENIYCNGAKQAIKIIGLPEMPINNIEFNNVTISSVTGCSSKETKAVHYNKVIIIPEKGPVFNIVNSKE